VVRAHSLALRTAHSWVARYREAGLVGLARKRRTDQGQRRVPPELHHLIEGLALQKTKPSAATIHRQVAKLATEHGWDIPSYSCVYAIVKNLDPGLRLLAQEGSKAYQNAYDLVYRREASQSNEIWQADHTPLNLWALNEHGQPARPWLTVIEDDFSRCIAGYFLTFQAPNALNTALALRQAIWRKPDTRWRICGIPAIFYTDHGSDFRSQHMEQVCIDLKSQLIFSTVGMPRGRGRIERFFLTVDQLFLQQLPGFAPEGKPLTPPTLTLSELDARFLAFLLDEYHVRQSRDWPNAPQVRWEQGSSGGGFLPRLPESLEQLDLLLLTVAKTRRVRRDGIYFQGLRYLDPLLAAYVGEDVVIRYDPRDLAEIRIYHEDKFLCRAVCQELADQTISLKELVRARTQQRRTLQKEIKERSALVQTYMQVPTTEPPPASPLVAAVEPSAPPTRRLKLYENE
jgi:putative transposase